MNLQVATVTLDSDSELQLEFRLAPAFFSLSLSDVTSESQSRLPTGTQAGSHRPPGPGLIPLRPGGAHCNTVGRQLDLSRPGPVGGRRTVRVA
jgi:hypothetical protein